MPIRLSLFYRSEMIITVPFDAPKRSHIDTLDAKTSPSSMGRLIISLGLRPKIVIRRSATPQTARTGRLKTAQ